MQLPSLLTAAYLMLMAAFWSPLSAQTTVFYSDQFNGGVATGAFSLGIASSGSGSFVINVPAGSTIHQAWFFGTRTGAGAAPVTVQLNGTPYTFNNLNQIGNSFNSLYGGASATHAIDVTANILPGTTNYTISVPPQGGSVTNVYNEFLLYIDYENPSLPEVNTVIYISELDCQGTMNYTLNTPTPVNTANPVGLAILAGYAGGTGSQIQTDCEDVTVNGTLVGTFYGFDYNAASTFGSTGTFEYYNNTLNGLGDDDENQAILGPDVLSDISAVIPNNTTSIPVTLTHCPSGSLSDNMIWLLFLTYSNDTCGFIGLDLGPDTSLCQGQNLVLDASFPNATYTWQDGSTDSTFLVTQSGIYAVEINVNGCLRTDSVAIVVNPLPVVNLGNDTTLCAGEVLMLDATQPNAGYLWQDGSTGAVYNASQPGTYWVNVTAGGCTGSDTLNLTYTPLPVVNLGPDTLLCPGQTLLLDVTTANGTYVWQDGTTQPVFTVSGAGTYMVTVTVDGCSGIDSVSVTYTSPATVNLGADTTICQGEFLTLDATYPGATYLWQDGSTAPVYTITSQGTYWVSLTNYCGTVTDTLSVVVTPLPAVSLGNDTTLCDGDILVLDVTTANAVYLWQNGSALPVFTVGQAGTYYVNVTVDGCGSSDTIQVNYNPVPLINLGNDTTLCAGEILVLDATTPGAVYTWQDLSVNPTYNVTQPGEYFVLVTLNGCTGSDSISVTFTPLPLVELGPDTALCQGETLVLNIPSFNATFVWQDGSTGNTFTVMNPGTYWVIVTENGCSETDSISVAYNALPVVALGSDTVLCAGQSILLDASTANSTYVWQDGSSGATLVAAQQGLYWVQVTVNGCSASDSLQLGITPLPAVNLGPDTTICFGDMLNFDFNVSGASYLWQDGSINGSYQVSGDGIYWLQITAGGCSGSDTVAVATEDCEVILIMPNVITPNGDGLNDVWTPIQIKGVSSMETMVFNRWGNEVFTTRNPQIGWNGRTGDGEIVDGVYYWIVNYSGLRGKKGSLKGTVTIMK